MEAEANGTSLNQFIRDCLEAKCAETNEVRRERGRTFADFAVHTKLLPT